MPATAAFEPLRQYSGSGLPDGVRGLLPLVPHHVAQAAPLWFGMVLPASIGTRFGPCALRHASLQSAAIGPHLRISGEIGAAAFTIALPEGAIAAMLTAARITHLEAIKDVLVLALVIEHLLGPVIETVEMHLRQPVMIAAVVACDGTAVAGLPLQFSFGAGIRVTAFFDMAHADLQALLPAPQITIGSVLSRQTLVPVSLCAGAMWVMAGHLAKWQTGDVIVFSAGNPPGDAMLCMAGGAVARVRPDGAALLLLTTFQRPLTPNHERTAKMAHTSAALDDVALMVSFDLGQRQMTLAELGQLTVGSLFEIGSFTDDQVKIRANGTVVGAARLVQIDDRLGVQIVALQTDHA